LFLEINYFFGRRLVSYWRTASPGGPFAVNLARGGAIDRHTDPHLITAAERETRRFCRRTGIDLAGFDFLFRTDPPDTTPLFLEINYFFGRRGLGGSDAYYRLLTAEIDRWVRGSAGREKGNWTADRQL
jgi:ribosomal protein S6--L-glutamate ligase